MCCFIFLKPISSGLIAEEYIGNGEDRVKNRDGFTEMLGDLMFTIPAIKTANDHRGSTFIKDYYNLFQNHQLLFTVTQQHDITLHLSANRCRRPRVPV